MENKTPNHSIMELRYLSKQEKDVHQKARYEVALLHAEGKSSQDISVFLHIPYRHPDNHSRGASRRNGSVGN